MEPFNHANMLSRTGLNTLLFSDPYAKLCYTTTLASAFESVAYIDLDTMFSAYFEANLVKDCKVDVYLPPEGHFMPMFKQVLASVPDYSLVIFDSINSFYTMYYGYYKSHESGGGRNLNHLLSVLLMLLVKQGVTSSVPVLATSMLRYRKEGEWKQSPTSRRLLMQKSSSRFYVEMAGDQLALKVLEHETVPRGTSIACRSQLYADKQVS